MIQFPITNKLAVKPTNSTCKPPMALITLTCLRKLAKLYDQAVLQCVFQSGLEASSLASKLVSKLASSLSSKQSSKQSSKLLFKQSSMAWLLRMVTLLITAEAERSPLSPPLGEGCRSCR